MTGEKNGCINNSGGHISISKTTPLIQQMDSDLEKTPSTDIDDDCALLANGISSKELFDLRMEQEKPPPPDKYSSVFLIFLIHGIGILMPWNIFITAEKYFVDYKLGRDTNYGKNFLPYLGIASQVPSLCVNLINAFCHCGGSLTLRIVVSIAIMVLVTIFTIVMAMVDSSHWVAAFFWVTMASVVVINCATGVYQNSIYGLAGNLPMKYSGAVVLGNNISGTLTALMSLISLVAAPDVKTATIYYFIGALVILLICFDSYFLLPQCQFFKYYGRRARLHQINENVKRHKENKGTRRVGTWTKIKQASAPYIHVFKKAWVQFFNVFFIFFVTLTIFPAIQANISRADPDFFISEKYFTVVTCFLLFNFFAMIGNIIPHWIRVPEPKYLWIPVSLRALMIPYFMFCNYKFMPAQYVVFNDWAYIVMAILMALTSGYYSSLGMMYAPRVVDAEHAGKAGMMAAFFLVLGVVLGVQFTLVIVSIAESLPGATNSTLTSSL